MKTTIAISFRKLCLLFIFMENWFLPVNLGFDFRLTYILYFVFLVIYPFTYRYVKVSNSTLLTVTGILAILSLSSVFNVAAFIESSRQLLLIGFNMVFGLLLLNAYSNDIRTLFKDYCSLAYFAAIIGLIQLTSQIVGFKNGADYSYLGFEMQNFDMSVWRIQSWLQEPSFLAIVLLPVAFASVCRLMNISDIISKERAIIVLAVLVLTQAASGLLGLVICVAIAILTKYSLLKSPIFMFASVVIATGVVLGLYMIPMVKERADDTARIFFQSNVTASDIESVNISTYGIYSNYKIATAALADKPVFGYGLGNYQYVYHSYLYKVLPYNSYTEVYLLNDRDANSLLLRIAAETGAFGLLLMGAFLYFYRIRGVNLKVASQEEIEFWIINSGMYVVIIVRLLRQGHYTMIGFVLVLMLYYMSKKNFREQKGTNALQSDLETATI